MRTFCLTIFISDSSLIPSGLMRSGGHRTQKIHTPCPQTGTARVAA